jgi:uncharacterized protein (DUF362 family)
MSSAKVALVRCEDYEPARVAAAVERQFELLGGLGAFIRRGDTVLLKPNFIAPRSHRHSAAQTHPAVILEAARLLKDYGAKPFVADSPAWANSAICARVLGLTEPLRKLGVPIRQLKAPRKCELGPDGPRVGISSLALDADAIINLPKLKTHQQMIATFAVKNMFGCVSGKHKALWHLRKGNSRSEFARLLVGVCQYLRPALTIIDGIVAMHGQGPIRGPSKPLGWLIGGTDPVACERICCRLVGIEPDQLPILQTARQIGYGCSDLDQIEIVGDLLPATPCPDFEPAKLILVKFTFGRVCRSIARQVLLLARGLKPGKGRSRTDVEQTPDRHSSS